MASYCDQSNADHAIIMFFNQHPDMPHPSCGWIILGKEKRSLFMF